MPEIADRQQALDAALAQIDRAFGGEAPAQKSREQYKVWTDPVTEDLVWYYIRDRVGDFYDEDNPPPWHDDFWLEVSEELDRGEHRIIEHPFRDRIFPLAELTSFGFFIRRIMGWFQRPGRDD